jgi:hypothetical protein
MHSMWAFALFTFRQACTGAAANIVTPKVDGALLVGASTVAAIWLRSEPVQPSPKLRGIVHDSVQPVRLVMIEIQK